MHYNVTDNYQKPNARQSCLNTSDVSLFALSKFRLMMQHPLAFILLVWGMLFLFGGILLVCAQGHKREFGEDRQPSAQTISSQRCEFGQFEVIEIFSTGTEIVFPAMEIVWSA